MGTFQLVRKWLDAFPLQLHNHRDSDWCLCIGRLFCITASVTTVSRSSCTVKSWQEWYWKISGMKLIPYKTAVFLLTCKADQGKKSSGFQRFIIKWKKACFISAVKSH
ncbi:hypothetical protein QIY_3272 [Clostridioides difficile DA00141]|nr:hypothetical protein QIY_3272 [Clostridioides difficile DA00141]